MEIKPQELRIGNMVWSVEANEATEIFLMGIHRLLEEERDNKPRSYKPIELTHEWLERCKAINRTNITSEIIFGSYRSLEIVKDTDGYRLHLTTTTGGNISLRKIKYLHELQNSYHGVFGEELAIDKQISNGN